MAQHDYVIANASGATVRADINNMALAISSNNSGSSAPSTTYAYLWWLDTSANVLKLRNSANNAWITMPFSITANNTVDINSGAIDGTPIGASAASTGAFTTLSASGNLTVGGSIDVDGTSNLDVVDIDGALTQDGGAVFNEASADADFRVESNANANAIFVNGGDDRVTFFNGTTINAASGTDDGVSHYSDGRTDISRASGQALNLRRRTDDGVIVNFYKEASGTVANVGSIGVKSGDLVIHSNTSGHVGLSFGNTRLEPTNNAGSLSDGNVDLGNTDSRFKDLYLSGGAYLGGTAAANALDDYEEGTWDPSFIGTAGSAGSWAESSWTARYTKIGRVVRFHASGYVTNKGSYSGSSRVAGLPYTNAGSTTACVVSMFPDSNYPNSKGIVANVLVNSTEVHFFTGARADVAHAWADVGTGYYCNISGHYEVS
jgi:hypothetical protein